ncbi:MAG: hypothetical protein EOP87_00175 [Verrucomicrobiaceae bacterium]|nr:MAG: hypothetical protein EOP87_00175 [Verrucomicrobiaceae bacterium]
MTLNYTAQSTLEMLTRNTSPAIQNEINTRYRAANTASVADGRVIVLDWTCAYLGTTAAWSISPSGLSALTNTAVTPTVTVPHDGGTGAPTLSMKALALDVFAISTEAVDGELRDGEVTVTLARSGPVTMALSKLCLSTAAPVAHFHWSGDQTNAWASLGFSGIKQHGIRILALLAGKA